MDTFRAYPLRHKRPLLIFLAAALVFQARGQAAQLHTLADLQQGLSEHISQPKFAGALWGVKVVSLDTGRTIFEHNSEKLFSPASNSKLYTVALALDRLGADYQIKTSLYAASKADKSGMLRGDLIVYGRGDPTINARLHTNDLFRALDPILAALTNAGVRHIAGDLILDNSFIRGPPYGSGWVWDDLQNYYGAEISALTINDNALELSLKPAEQIGARCKLAISPATCYLALSNRTQTAEPGSQRSIHLFRPLNENVLYVSGKMALDDAGYNEEVTVHNPAGLFGCLLKEHLARHGIKVASRLQTMTWLERQLEPIACEKMVELGSVKSMPLREIAREVMKPSQNLYADLLLAHVGEHCRTEETPGEISSEELGITELRSFLLEAGVQKGEVLFEEGSGLSRDNLTTPNATIALLKYMARHKTSVDYLESLPIAGVDGTLKERMRDTPAAGNVRAKTGTLRWANSLSGHVRTAGGDHLLFSIMLNRFHDADPNHSARAEIDAIAVMLAGFAGRIDPN